MSSVNLSFLVQTVVGLIVPLLAGVCAIFCLVYRRLSPWLILMALGFLGYCLLGIVNRLGWWYLFQNSVISSEPTLLQVFSYATSFGFIVAFFLLMLSLVLALGDIQRQMMRLRNAGGDLRERLPISETRESWRPRQEGSRDIQS
jgi:hypothetical protein